MKSCSTCKNPESKVGIIHKRNSFLICEECFGKLPERTKELIIPLKGKRR